MTEPILGIAQYLDAQGVGDYEPDSAGGSIYVQKLPQTPDEAIGIFASGGFEASGVWGYDNPTVNVQVRGAPHDPVGALAKARAVYSALHGFHMATLPDGTFVINCRGIQSGPVSLGPDENDRFRFSLNFQLEVRNVTEHRE